MISRLAELAVAWDGPELAARLRLVDELEAASARSGRPGSDEPRQVRPDPVGDAGPIGLILAVIATGVGASS